MRRYQSGICGTILACALALAAGNADGAVAAKKFRVTLKATVTKTWNTATTSTDAQGCSVTVRSVGKRVVTLRSSKPTIVTVGFRSGRAAYAPAFVRLVRVALAQTGSTTTTVGSPCAEKTTKSRCSRATRSIRATKFKFFRSRKDEISFRPSRLPGGTGCPRETRDVRALAPGLEDAQGKLSEAALESGKYPAQTAVGSAQTTSELDGAETGTVVERVNWALTFERAR